MKGRVKLELFDKDGRVVEKREDNNMLTTLIQNMHMPLAYSKDIMCNYYRSERGGTASAVDSNYYGICRVWGPIRALFGTLELFDAPLSDDPADYVHHGENIVGLATYKVVYAGTNGLYGSYNASESAWSDDKNSLTLVFDFGTSQGNGEIASLALAPISAKFCGTGVDYSDSSTNMMSTSQYAFEKLPSEIFSSIPGDTALPRFAGSNLKFICANHTNDLVIMLDVSKWLTTTNDYYYGKTGKILLDKLRVPLANAYIDYYASTQMTTGRYKTKEIQVSIMNPLNAEAANYGFYNAHGDYLYFMFSASSTWVAGATLTLTKYNPVDETEEFIEVMNTTGKTIYLGAYDTYTNYSRPGYCNGEKLFVMCTDNTMYLIDLADNSNNQQIYYRGAEAKPFAYNACYQYFGCGDDVFINNNYSSYASNVTYWNVNFVTGEMKVVQMGNYDTIAPGEYNPQIIPFMDIPGMYLWVPWYASSNTNFLGSGCASGVLKTTKLNLDAPVTKTSDLTMKVTYTLTFSDEPTEEEETTNG